MNSKDHTGKRLLLRGFLFLMSGLLSFSCTTGTEPEEQTSGPEGSLFIIGGGPRPAALIQSMLDEATGKEGPVVILSFASGQEDTALFYGARQFRELGVDSIVPIDSPWLESDEEWVLRMVGDASVVYMTGGDQTRFMDRISGTEIERKIHGAYASGAVIAGTSAGAAVMSRKMITGNEFKHPEYTGDFPTIEAENIELTEGLGLEDRIIVDQHFIRRQRMNRLLAVALENPEELCLGIDESTAVIIHGDAARVVGEGQVISIRNPGGPARVKDGLLGGEGLQVSVSLPGDTILLP